MEYELKEADLSAHRKVLDKLGWLEEHIFADGGIWFLHPEIEGDLLIQPSGQWQLISPNFEKEEVIKHGDSAKDLEAYLARFAESKMTLGVYRIWVENMSPAKKLQRLIENIGRQLTGMETEIVPFLVDAIDQKKDVSNRAEAMRYIASLASKEADLALKYLESISDEEYFELYDFIMGELE